jgi:hypothetical protein
MSAVSVCLCLPVITQPGCEQYVPSQARQVLTDTLNDKQVAATYVVLDVGVISTIAVSGTLYHVAVIPAMWELVVTPLCT